MQVQASTISTTLAIGTELKGHFQVGPIDLVTGKFHGNRLVEDVAILNGNGTISILLNTTQ